MGTFQGKDVNATKMSLTGGAKELMFDKPPMLDQIVRVTVEGRVTGVDHRVNEKSGDLEEVIRVKVMDIDDITEISAPGSVRYLPSTGTTP